MEIFKKNGIVLVAIFGIVFAVLVLIMAFRNATVEPAEPNALIDSLETEDTVPVQDVVDSPQVYDDREIIVRGQIDKWITKRLFYLEVNDLTIVEKGLLVYSDTEYAPPQNAEEDELSLGSTPVVEIKGTLKDYSDDELRTLFDSEIDESEFDLYDNMPVLFMTSLTIIE